MEDRKLQYLLKQLTLALEANDHSAVNICYQELQKISSSDQWPELAQQVNDFNNSHANTMKEAASASFHALKESLSSANRKIASAKKMQIIGLGGGLGVMVFGLILVISLDYAGMIAGATISALGLLMIIIGTIFSAKISKAYRNLILNREKAYHYFCQKETKLQFLERVSEEKDTYLYNGQMEGYDRDGFGIGVVGNWMFYVGQWANDKMNGIGTLYSNDLRMVLEGEFSENNIHGIVDICWDDGSQWHGEYRKNNPWNGEGKCHTGVIGVWRNGVNVG